MSNTHINRSLERTVIILFTCSIPPYTYDRVAREIESLEPILLGIIAGEVESSHHRVYMDGARKERNQLKVGNKLGPISKWSSSKVSNGTSQKI